MPKPTYDFIKYGKKFKFGNNGKWIFLGYASNKEKEQFYTRRNTGGNYYSRRNARIKTRRLEKQHQRAITRARYLENKKRFKQKQRNIKNQKKSNLKRKKKIQRAGKKVERKRRRKFKKGFKHAGQHDLFYN